MLASYRIGENWFQKEPKTKMHLSILIGIFTFWWPLASSCGSTPPSQPRHESCDYCPECARYSTELIGGNSDFAKIKEVCTEENIDIFTRIGVQARS